MFRPISGFYLVRCCACAIHLPVSFPSHMYSVVHTTSLTVVPTAYLVFAFLFVGFTITLRRNTLLISARLTRAVRCSLSEFSVLSRGLTCVFNFPFLFALVVPLFLRFHLDLGCYVPFDVKEELRSWCLPSFSLVLPSRFVVTQLLISWILAVLRRY